MVTFDSGTASGLVGRAYSRGSRLSLLRGGTGSTALEGVDRRGAGSVVARNASNSFGFVDRRTSAFSYCMHSVLKNQPDESDDGTVKPAIVRFLESATQAILLAGLSPELRAALQEDPSKARAMLGDEDAELQEQMKMVRLRITHGTNFSTLAGLISSRSFGLNDRRLDDLLGSTTPLDMRKVLVFELCRVVDTLWEKFGQLLVNRFGSFEAAFKWLDADKSGAVDSAEFANAYVEMNVQGGGGERPEDDEAGMSSAAPTASAGDRKHASSFSVKRRLSGGLSSRKGGAGGGRGALVNNGGMSIARLNRLILKTESRFLFDMLRLTGDAQGYQVNDFNETGVVVSMHQLVMAITGLGPRAMKLFRERVVRTYSDLREAFDRFGKTAKHELTMKEFHEMYNGTFSGRRMKEEVLNAKRAMRTNVGEAAIEDAEREILDQAQRIFNSFDVDGSGKVSVSEMQAALAAHADFVSWGVFRRRVLLRFGSVESFFAKYSASALVNEEGQLATAALDLDMSSEDLLRYFPKLESDERDADGYSLEEFAIVLFLHKPEDVTFEELVLRRLNIERDKDITFREFADRFGSNQTSTTTTTSNASLLASRLGVTKGRLAVATVKKMKKTLPAAAAPSSSPASSSVAAAAPGNRTVQITLRNEELKSVFEAVMREHRRVTGRMLLRSMTNVSDVIALDRTSYKGGDLIVCRIRLTAENLKKCKDCVVAVVPERMEWKESGNKSYWMLDGSRVTDLTHVCDQVFELPKAPNGGGVQKDFSMNLQAPIIRASEERLAVRLLTYPSTREPGKQIGAGVPFDLLMPAPEPPHVDQVSLDADTGDASVVLHWSPPEGEFESAPITGFVVHVKPLIYEHTLLVEEGAEDEVDMERGRQRKVKDVEVWSPAMKRFTKKLSYGVDGLCRGVQYRFGVQCVHRSPVSGGGAAPQQDIRGTPSDFCGVVTMPLYSTTMPPAAPMVKGWNGSVFMLAWRAPLDEGRSDANQVSGYVLQYRHTPCGGSSFNGSSKSASEASDDDDDVASKSSGSSDTESPTPVDEGWVDISEDQVLTSSALWTDFIGWEVRCHISELRPIGGDGDTCPHEFRVAAVNHAGKSAWSDVSEAVPLQTATASDASQAPIQNLKVVQANCQDGSLRTHCVLSWDVQGVAIHSAIDKFFSVSIREAENRRGTFTQAAAYFRQLAHGSSELSVEAIVTGLEQYPKFGNLQLQVMAHIPGGDVEAQVALPGVDDSLAPPSEAPKVVNVHPSTGILELEWTVPGESCTSAAGAAPQQGGAMCQGGAQGGAAGSGSTPNFLANRSYQYALQVSPVEATDGQSEDASPKAKQTWDTIEDLYVLCKKDNTVRCMVSGFFDGSYVFRVGVVGPGGRRLPNTSPSTEAVSFCIQRAFESNDWSASAGPAADPGASGASPKQPRNVSVVRLETHWCELSWEQRALKGQPAPMSYEVQECREERDQDATWNLATSTFVSLEEGHDGEFWIVRAAVFFDDPPWAIPEPTAFGSGTESFQLGMPPQQQGRWRLRVRASESDWSAPTPWQPPFYPPLPAQPSLRGLSWEEPQCFRIFWRMLTSEAKPMHVELHAQLHQIRRGGKLSDWVPVKFFTTPPEADEDSELHSCITAVAMRQDVTEATHAANTDEVRFRILLSAGYGVAGPSSEPSDFVPIQVPLPPVQPPQCLDVAYQGRILAQTPVGDLFDAEFVRFQWPLPKAECDLGFSDDTTVPPAVYAFETEDVENERWLPVSGASIEVNLARSSVSALVPLPFCIIYGRRARFRVAVSRGRGHPVAYSRPSPEIVWGAFELDTPPVVVCAVPTLIKVAFVLPNNLARSGVCNVLATLETRKSAWVRQLAQNKRRGSWARQISDGSDQGTVRRKTRITFDNSDALSDVSDDDFEQAGHFPVHWYVPKPSTFNDTGIRSNTGECLCEGFVVLNVGDATEFSASSLVPGYEVRVGLRAGIFREDVYEAEPSVASAPAPVQEPPVFPHCSLRLEYPGWDMEAPPGSQVSCRACLWAAPPQLSDASEELVQLPELPFGPRQLSQESTVAFGQGRPSCQFRVVSGALPEGLELDSDNGFIHGIIDGAQPEDSRFTVEVIALAPWMGPDNTPVITGTSASTMLPGLDHSEAADESNDVGDDDAVTETRSEGTKSQGLCSKRYSNNSETERMCRKCKTGSTPCSPTESTSRRSVYRRTNTGQTLTLQTVLPPCLVTLQVAIDDGVASDFLPKLLERMVKLDDVSCKSAMKVIRRLRKDQAFRTQDDISTDSGSSSDSDTASEGARTQNTQPADDQGDAQASPPAEVDEVAASRATTFSDFPCEDWQRRRSQWLVRRPIDTACASEGEAGGCGGGKRSSMLTVEVATPKTQQRPRTHSPVGDVDEGRDSQRQRTWMSSHDSEDGWMCPKPVTMEDQVTVVVDAPDAADVPGDAWLEVLVSLNYPEFPPLLPAFTDIKIAPTVEWADGQKEVPLEDAPTIDQLFDELLTFEIHPPLPGGVSLDPITGVVRGSPLMEHVRGNQYTVTVRWAQSGAEAAHCALAFAVAPADLASHCNLLYLGKEPPAFRLSPANAMFDHVASDRSGTGDLPAQLSIAGDSDFAGTSVMAAEDPFVPPPCYESSKPSTFEKAVAFPDFDRQHSGIESTVGQRTTSQSPFMQLRMVSADDSATSSPVRGASNGPGFLPSVGLPSGGNSLGVTPSGGVATAAAFPAAAQALPARGASAAACLGFGRLSSAAETQASDVQHVDQLHTDRLRKSSEGPLPKASELHGRSAFGFAASLKSKIARSNIYVEEMRTRSSVFPLGPSLRERDVVQGENGFSLPYKAPMSARGPSRPRLPGLYR